MCNGQPCDGGCGGTTSVGLMTAPHHNPFESALQQNPKRASMATLLGPFPIGANPANGSIIVNQMETSQFARSLVFVNTSGSTLQIDNMKGFPIPPALNYVVRAQQAARHLQISVAVGGTNAGQLWCLTTEEELPPTIQFPVTASIGASVAVNSPLGHLTMASSVAVAIASDQTAIPVTVSSLAVTSTVTPVGANHHSGTVLTLPATLAARATRTGVTFYARATNVADVVIDGFHLHPGFTYNGSAVDLYTPTGTAGDILDVMEEFN